MKSYGAQPWSPIMLAFAVAVVHGAATLALFCMCVVNAQPLHWFGRIGQVFLVLLFFPLGWLEGALHWLNCPSFGIVLLNSPLVGVVTGLAIARRRKRARTTAMVAPHVSISRASGASR
jgi:hypothetical protein